MPGLRWAAAVPLVLWLSACGGSKSAPAPAEPAAADDTDSSTSNAPLRGVATTSGATTSFRPCGAPAANAMTVTDGSGELARAFSTLAAKPSDGIYVELAGEIDGTRLTLTSLLRAHALGGALACDAPVFDGEFVANGNEPFWAVEIRENGITFRSPEMPKGRTYPYAFTRTETGSVVYATKVEVPTVSTLEVALEPAQCADSMSGELRGFKAHVTHDGAKLEGCAIAGVPRGEFGSAPLDELNRFAGAYPQAVRVWKDPAIEARLEALLGKALPAFLANMKVESPVMKDGGIFYVTGSAPHRGGLDSAVFLADPATDTINAIVFVNAARRDFKEGGRDVAIPAEVATMIGNMDKR